MQPTNATPFNPLDFKKLSQQEQFEAARTMNQKELIAVAGTGVSLETLLKYQGLSDTEIQKRLKDLNPYLAEFSLINQRDNLKVMAAEKRSHAEFYAMLEEQSHAPTQAGHKLGNISNLSHDQQIHALAEHFSHGGSTSEALAALGESEAAQRKQDELEEQYRIEHKAELERIAKIKDEKKQKEERDAFDRKSRDWALGENNLIASAANRAKVKAANQSSVSVADFQEVRSDAATEVISAVQKSAQKIDQGKATKQDIQNIVTANLAQMSADDQKKYLKNNSELEAALIQQRIKADGDRTAKILTQAVHLNEEKVSDVKDLEKTDSKAASAEALKTGANSIMGGFEPKAGMNPDSLLLSLSSVKSRVQEKGAETIASAQAANNKITV